MKKSLMTTLLMTAAYMSQASVISAQNDFSDVSDWQLNGAANANANNRLSLTQTTNQSGSAFLNSPISLLNDVSFSAFFTFEMTNPSGFLDSDGLNGADGLAFVVQTNASNVGGTGGFIGYGGITQSLAVEFDTYDNGSVDASNGNHVGVSLNGNIASTVIVPEPILFNRNSGVWSVWVDYDGLFDNLEVRWSNTGVRSALAGISTSVDLTSVLGSSNAFFGFTSGTAAAGGLHEIISYEFRNDFDPIDDTKEVSAPAGIASLLFAGAFAFRRKIER